MIRVLLTDKKNYLVNNDGQVGFFGQDGKLLRSSDENEFNLNLRRMKELNSEELGIEFDFADLSKELKKTMQDRIKEVNAENKAANSMADFFSMAKKLK